MLYVYIAELCLSRIPSLSCVPHCLQVMSDHKTNEMTYQEKLNAEFGRSKGAEEEKALLREQIVDLRKVNTQPSLHVDSYGS